MHGSSFPFHFETANAAETYARPATRPALSTSAEVSDVSDIISSSVPKLPRGVRLHYDQVREAHVLLAPERAFNVDGNAVAVLQLVDGARTVADIAAALAEKYAADKTVIATDIGRMIEDLVAKRVMETS